MAALSLDNGILYIRQLLGITNTSFPGPSDAEITKSVNDRYMTWFKLYEQRSSQSETLVATTSLGQAIYSSAATFIHPEILAAERLTAGVPVPLERLEWNEMMALLEADPTTGAPIRYAAFQNAASNEWNVALHPIPGAVYAINAYHRVYPTALSGTAVPVLGDAEGYWLYRFAAADLAASGIVGRPDLVEHILSPIPEAIRIKFQAERKRHDPKRRPEEESMVIS